MKFPFMNSRTSVAGDADAGIMFGYSESLNRKQREPAYISPEALTYHSLVVGKSRTGKTTLLTLLAKAAMERDISVIVMDADGDLAPVLLGEVPSQRVDETTYFDLTNIEQVIGLNLLDPATARFPSLIVETIARASEMLWKSGWSADQDDALRLAISTLLKVNERLMEEKQDLLTVLDLVPLFELPGFRRKIVRDYLRDYDFSQWWTHNYEWMPQEMRLKLTKPLFARFRPLRDNPIMRNILGQPNSAINFRELLAERRITLINLAQLAIPHETREWLGTILTRLLGAVVSEETDSVETLAHGQLLVLLNGFQPVALVDEFAMLPDFQRRGVGIVFTETTLARLEQLKPFLASTLLTNVTNLFAFRTTLQDSERLSAELGAGMSITELVDLPDHFCYAKVHHSDRTWPGRRVQLLQPTLAASVATREHFLSRIASCTRPAHEVARARRAFEDRWHGREDEVLRRFLLDREWGNTVPGMVGGYIFPN